LLQTYNSRGDKEIDGIDQLRVTFTRKMKNDILTY